jgi:hypothetical protein
MNIQAKPDIDVAFYFDAMSLTLKAVRYVQTSFL